MRADHEERKRKRIEAEVWHLRDRISDMNLKIATMTKGIPISKVFVTKITQHQQRLKKLCNSHIISKMFSVNNTQEKEKILMDTKKVDTQEEGEGEEGDEEGEVEDGKEGEKENEKTTNVH
jgi:serine phosphatase RsbU (regulator of sigma subunit)